jgi:phospholipid/cholesterol/gamma-HCH transport system substrate-binding protein
MKNNIIELLVGFAVIIIAASFFIFGYKINYKDDNVDNYTINAYFQNIEGLEQGSDVKLSGIKIGYVENITLEKDTYYAIVKMRINKAVEIPADSRAIVSTSGILGGNYVRITPGGDDVNLADNEKIKFTQSALNLEDLIGKLMYAVTSKN